jgi:hypothetical protein
MLPATNREVKKKMGITVSNDGRQVSAHDVADSVGGHISRALASLFQQMKGNGLLEEVRDNEVSVHRPANDRRLPGGGPPA